MKSIIFLFLLSILINVKSYCQQTDCGNLKAGIVLFRKGDSKISASGMFQLNKLGDDMRANPNCKVSIESTASGSKRDLQISWNRTNQVINYMVEKQGIDRNDLFFDMDRAVRSMWLILEVHQMKKMDLRVCLHHFLI